MSFLLSNRALLRGMLAAAVVLTGTACSRPDRSDRSHSGSDTSAAILPDSSSNTAQPSSGGTAYSDSSAQPSTSAQSNTARAETAPPRDKDAAGYRPMERDTTNIPDQQSDSARVTADTTQASSVPAAAGYSEMARDTSTVAEQAETAAVPSGDVALQASIDTNSQADSTQILGQVTTNSTAEGVSPDSIDFVRVRPPEDSTELLGNVPQDEAADETADEQVVRPEDREAVAASEAPADEVGAAAIGGNVTGAEAVALMERAGVRCAVVDPEANEAVRWDMSSTPVSLNPCGMGSMVLSRIWTVGQGDSGTAGQ